MGTCFSGDKTTKGSRIQNNNFSDIERISLQDRPPRPSINIRNSKIRKVGPRALDVVIEDSPAISLSQQNKQQKLQDSHYLPQDIISFMDTSQKRQEELKKSVAMAKDKDMQHVASFFGCNGSNITSSILTSQQSYLTQIQVNSAIEVITSYGHQIYESKYERQLLTTSEFQRRLQRVHIVEEQPGIYYQFLNQLGKGSMCKVYKATDRRKGTSQFAVRIISVEKLHYLPKIKEEIAVMSLCQSWNIVTYHFSYYYQGTLFMFIQYMAYGSLARFISKNARKIPQNIIAYIIKEILKGLQVIHARRQLHRDLKSDNILINKKGQVKIGDFGYALQLTKERTTACDLAGTPAWMAPELIKRQQYTQAVDIWSLGIILVQLVEGQPKYLKMRPILAMIMIASKPPETVTGKCSSQLKTFLNRCLKKDPNHRATARQLLLDPFITQIGSGNKEKQHFVGMLQAMKEF